MQDVEEQREGTEADFVIYATDFIRQKSLKITQFHLNSKNDTLFCFSVGCDWLAVLLQRKTEEIKYHEQQRKPLNFTKKAQCKACIFYFHFERNK